MQKKPLLLLLMTCLAAKAVTAKAIRVTSLSALETAIANSSPGTEIVLANGIYMATNAIRIARQGTAAQPITISAETIVGAEITGAEGFHPEPPAAYITIQGFKFTHDVGDEEIAAGANHCRYTRCTFELPGRRHYLMVSGDDAKIDHNTFQNKFTEGQMVVLYGPGADQMSQRTWIHHNCFTSFPNARVNNCSSANGVGNIPEEGFKLEDPMLARDGDGEMHPQKGSPVIAAAAGSYAFATVDIAGKMRTGKLDIGAEQFCEGKVINRILTTADVGPQAL